MRAFPDPSDGLFHPKYNLPSTPAIQLALYSLYHLPSPYLEGTNFFAGRSYEIRLTMSEKHLLPVPYQTNCTNYLEEWKLRGGKAPMNQMDVVQECRMKKYYEGMRCVPVDVDYPHEHPICKMCPDEKCNFVLMPSNTNGRASSQCSGRYVIKALFSGLWNRSTAPLLCGWYSESGNTSQQKMYERQCQQIDPE
ncbi:hypothetical protein AVEN_15006-1 [Araneus ventricosus]|uniref:Uncharacterized protein n=1 Tax=Araneus ventricosus TaxID=182803 RepID=A0A4Y2FVR9_ARAVE|nr:hypothetical protein AVEN_15006-1 [Araneus ventricosus]